MSVHIFPFAQILSPAGGGLFFLFFFHLFNQQVLLVRYVNKVERVSLGSDNIS